MCGLYIVGSSLNGFGNNKSDMDLCLMITNRDVSFIFVNKKSIIYIFVIED